MERKYIVWLFVGLIFFSLTTKIYGSDGERRGYVWGGGLGPGMTSYTLEVYVYDVNDRFVGVKTFRENNLTLVLDTKFGFAPHNLWAGYFTFKMTVGDNVSNSLMGLGVSHWFRHRAPSALIAGGFGISTLTVENRSESGFGLFVGGGYQYRRIPSIEVYLLWGKYRHLYKQSLSLMLVFGRSVGP